MKEIESKLKVTLSESGTTTIAIDIDGESLVELLGVLAQVANQLSKQLESKN